jgi:hypothetical protein
MQGSIDGSTFTTLAASAGRVFDPASGNTVTVSFPAASARYVRVTVGANTGWPAAQLAALEVYAATGQPTDPPPTAPGNLAAGRPATASGQTQSYGPGNAVDGNAGSYWESANNAFPQWIQVDLGSALAVGRVVLKLPPPAVWAARTQTLSVQGGTNGSSFTTLVASGGRVFDPASGNAVTLTFPARSVRYLRVQITANTGWPAGQLSELEAYAP